MEMGIEFITFTVIYTLCIVNAEKSSSAGLTCKKRVLLKQFYDGKKGKGTLLSMMVGVQKKKKGILCC